MMTQKFLFTISMKDKTVTDLSLTVSMTEPQSDSKCDRHESVKAGTGDLRY